MSRNLAAAVSIAAGLFAASAILYVHARRPTEPAIQIINGAPHLHGAHQPLSTTGSMNLPDGRTAVGAGVLRRDSEQKEAVNGKTLDVDSVASAKTSRQVVRGASRRERHDRRMVNASRAGADVHGRTPAVGVGGVDERQVMPHELSGFDRDADRPDETIRQRVAQRDSTSRASEGGNDGPRKDRADLAGSAHPLRIDRRLAGTRTDERGVAPIRSGSRDADSATEHDRDGAVKETLKWAGPSASFFSLTPSIGSPAVPEFLWPTIPDDCNPSSKPLDAESRANIATAQRWLKSIEASPLTPQWIKQEYRSELRCGGQIVRGWLAEIRITGDGSLSPLYYMCRQGYDSPLYLKTYSVTIDRPAGGPFGQFVVQRNGPERPFWHVPITDQVLTLQQRFGLPPQPGTDCVKDCTFFYPAPCERLRSVWWTWQVKVPGRIHPVGGGQ